MDSGKGKSGSKVVTALSIGLAFPPCNSGWETTAVHFGNCVCRRCIHADGLSGSPLLLLLCQSRSTLEQEPNSCEKSRACWIYCAVIVDALSKRLSVSEKNKGGSENAGNCCSSQPTTTTASNVLRRVELKGKILKVACASLPTSSYDASSITVLIRLIHSARRMGTRW